MQSRRVRFPIIRISLLLFFLALFTAILCLGPVGGAHASSGSGWVDQTPAGGISFLRDVEAVDALTAWAVGGSGTIVRTSDGGSSWTPQDAGLDTTYEILAISAADADTAWAVANRGYDKTGALLKTSNGGLDWTTLYNISGLTITGICALDRDTVWATAYQSSGLYPSNALIFSSGDGGETWTPRLSVAGMYIPADISIADENNIWVVGVDASTGGGFILKTSDGGSTWRNQYPGLTYQIVSVTAVSAKTAWVAGSGSTIMKTSDGGTTWLRQNAGVNAQFTSIHAVDTHAAWAAGFGGIVKTVDGGSSWVLQYSSATPSYYRVDALDPTTAWCVGVIGAGTSGVILKTEGGGDARPDIVSLIPCLGTTGTEVIVYGRDFGTSRGTSYVSFGGLPATEYTLWSDSQVKVRVPAGVAGEIAVVVTTLEGTSNPLSFWFQEKLSVVSVNPNQGTQLTFAMNIDIAGTGFQTGAAVRLEKGGTILQAGDVVVLSNTSVACSVGLFGVEPGVYDVVVTGPDGQEARLAGGFAVTSTCGAGSGSALLMLGVTLGLLSLAGSIEIRRSKKR